MSDDDYDGFRRYVDNPRSKEEIIKLAEEYEEGYAKLEAAEKAVKDLKDRRERILNDFASHVIYIDFDEVVDKNKDEDFVVLSSEKSWAVLDKLEMQGKCNLHQCSYGASETLQDFPVTCTTLEDAVVRINNHFQKVKESSKHQAKSTDPLRAIQIGRAHV